MREKKVDVPFVAATDSHEETLELYESGVRYVIQTEYLAAESFREIFANELKKGGNAFKEIGVAHEKKIKKIQKEMDSIFKLV